MGRACWMRRTGKRAARSAVASLGKPGQCREEALTKANTYMSDDPTTRRAPWSPRFVLARKLRFKKIARAMRRGRCSVCDCEFSAEGSTSGPGTQACASTWACATLVASCFGNRSEHAAFCRPMQRPRLVGTLAERARGKTTAPKVLTGVGGAADIIGVACASRLHARTQAHPSSRSRAWHK